MAGRGAAVRPTRHPARPGEQGTRLWLVHFGVIHEMSCQTDRVGGSQRERMNCSLWKPSGPQPPPTRAGSWEEVRGHTPQPSHPHCVVQRLAEPGRIPGFLFLVLQLAHCLFYIFIFTRRESPPQPARRKPWAGRGRPRASSREPPSLCAHAHCWDQGAPWVSPWVAAVWATPPHAALGAWCLRGLGQSSFTHSPNRDPSRAPPAGARRQEKRRSSPSLPLEEPTGDRREPMLSRDTRGGRGRWRGEPTVTPQRGSRKPSQSREPHGLEGRSVAELEGTVGKVGSWRWDRGGEQAQVMGRRPS